MFVVSSTIFFMSFQPGEGTDTLLNGTLTEVVDNSPNANDSAVTAALDDSSNIANNESSKKGLKNILPSLKGNGLSFMSLLRGLLGLVVLVFIGYLFSNNRKKISWRVIGVGLLIQAILAISVLYIPFVQTFFEFFGSIFVKILEFTNAGTEFLFKSFETQQIEKPLWLFDLHLNYLSNSEYLRQQLYIVLDLSPVI